MVGVVSRKSPRPRAAIPRREVAPSRQERDRTLRCSLVDGVALGGMVGRGETYLPAVALAMGMGETLAGLVASLPLMAGGLLQLISPRAIVLLGSHRRWVVLCAAIQALVFLPLTLAAWQGAISAPLLFALAAIYWGSGLATGPAWNTWIGTLVPPSIRPRYFASRTRASQLAVFLSFVAAGFLLQRVSDTGAVHFAYAALFASAALFRLISTVMLARQSEPQPIPARMRNIPWRQLLRHLRDHGGGRLLAFLVVMQAAVQMAGPYFTPFMLKQLQFNYGQFVALVSAAFLAKIIALPWWGRRVHAMGAQRLLWLGAWGILPLSSLWLVSQNFWWLMLIQVAGGMLWAAYELAFFLLFFESIEEEERTSLLTFYNLLNTTAWASGALLGGGLLSLWGLNLTAYLSVFFLSTVGRCFALLLLWHFPIRDVAAREVGVRTLAVRPNLASLDAPVLPSLPDQTTPPAAEVVAHRR